MNELQAHISSFSSFTPPTMLKSIAAFVLSVSVVAAAPLLFQEPSFTSTGSGLTTIGELAGVSLRNMSRLQ